VSRVTIVQTKRPVSVAKHTRIGPSLRAFFGWRLGTWDPADLDHDRDLIRDGMEPKPNAEIA
jgi:hypothetical protein